MAFWETTELRRCGRPGNLRTRFALTSGLSLRCIFDNISLRGEIQAWDLQSLLIKPVQRVLKYPLLLDKLVETTSSKHDDRVSVMNARETMGQVAQDINEVKRRKDIG